MRHLLMPALLVVQAAIGATVVRVDVDSVVHPVTVEIVAGAIAQASQNNADLILLRLDTPGGLMEASREVVQLMNGSPIPVAAWVAPSGARAASAGFFLLLASDVAVMAPGTRTGAASPVLLGRELDPVMRKKVESDASAWIRSLAARRGRNAALAEQTITEAKSFTEEEALKAGLVDLIAANEADLLEKLNGRDIVLFNGEKRQLNLKSAVVTSYELTVRQKIFKAISDPNLAFILLVLGALGLYIEFSSPGLIVPGVLGALLLLLGLGALSVLPINWLGVALIILALGLFIAEAFFTSYGVLGIGGAAALILGALLLVEGPPEFRIGLATAAGVGIPFALIAIFLTTLVVRAQKRKPYTGESGMIGLIGVARTPLEPEGKVFVHGEYWDASATAPVPEGSRVRVIAVDGLRLRVEPVP